MIFMDPGYQPAPKLPVIPSVKPIQPDPPLSLDREIVNYLRDQPEAVPNWTMANAVAALFRPANRSARRQLTIQALSRITALNRARLVRRVGRHYLALR